MKRVFILLGSHLLAIGIGFGLGVYFLPILVAPSAPAASDLAAAREQALYSGEFRRDLPGSDAFHWGEGRVYIGRRSVALEGELAPGPDYKLYLSPEYVETSADFERVKPRMVRVGDVKTFRNFVVPVAESIDPAGYNAVIVWCETFSMFITAARYK
jgi:hypothetical protein